MKATVILPILLALLLVTGVVLAADGLASPRYLLSGGGGLVHYGDFAVHGSIGQAVAGRVENAPFGLGSGFWMGAVRAEYRIYLPLILRNVP